MRIFRSVAASQPSVPDDWHGPPAPVIPGLESRGLLQLQRDILDLSGEVVVALGIVLGHRGRVVRAHVGGLVR